MQIVSFAVAAAAVGDAEEDGGSACGGVIVARAVC